MRASRLGWILLLATTVTAEPGRLYLTDFGRRVLVRTDGIVRARVAHVQAAFRGITTARLRVLRHLDGYDRSREVVLMYVDDLTAPDAFGSTLERSTIAFERGGKGKPTTTRKSTEAGDGVKAGRRPGVRLAVGEEALFFLKKKGATYTLVGLIPAADPRFEAKLARLESVLKIERIPAMDLRVREAKRYFLADMRNESVWERGNSAREVLNLATRFPKEFSEQEGRFLSGLLLGEKQAPIQAALERTVRALDPKAAMRFATEAEERERRRFEKQLLEERERLDRLKLPSLKANDVFRVGKRYGRAATGLVALYLDDDEAVVRERAAQTLAEFGGPSCRGPLRERLSKEKSPEAAAAMIYACGVKSDAEAVEVVAARLSDPALERTAITALARIGTGPARDALLRHRARGAAEVRDLIDSLLEEEFGRPR